MARYIILYTLLFLTACQPGRVSPDRQTDTSPVLFPDYTDVTFPCNIAAPNFLITEEGEAFYTEIGSEGQVFFSQKSRNANVRIPAEKWKALTTATAGKEFYIRICVRQGGKWIQYKDI